jgi:putative DNA primase/helicase
MAFREDVQWNQIRDYEVPLANGVLDIRSMALRPHRADDMLTACPVIAYQPDAQCPTWMRCLDEWFPVDDTHATTLQEFGGYCLMSRAELKTALMVIGPSDCGKTVYSNILREIVGIENTCCVTPDAMDDPMKVAPIMGKMINIVPELSDGSEIADGGFKRLISTGEGVAIRKLYRDQITYVPTCKHIFIANSPPRVKDESEGVYNRLLYVTYSVVIDRSDQDLQLHDKLMAEREGILLWMLEGLQRVVLNGRRFSPGGRRDLKNYRDSQNPIHAFIADECEIDADARTHLPELRQRFSQWSGKPSDPKYIARILRQAGFEITPSAVHIGMRKARAVIGLRLA